MKNILLLMVALLSPGTATIAQEKVVSEYADTLAFHDIRKTDVNNLPMLPDMMRVRLEVCGGINALDASNVYQPIKPEGSFGILINRNVSWSLWETGLRWNWRQYNLKGFIPQYAPETTKLETFTNTLEIPLTIGALLRENNNIQYALKMGIYLEAGLFGNGTLYKTDKTGAVIQQKIDNVYKDLLNFTPFQRFDIGGRLGIDIYVKDWKFGFEYTHGWRDIHTGYDRHIKNKNFNLSVGYIIKEKIHKETSDVYIVY